MDSQKPEANAMNNQDEEREELEVTRDELVAALQEVVRDLSEGLKGTDREEYLTADDLAQNDWFFAGVSDEAGQFAVTMWPAEGEEDMLRIDIGTEADVQQLASSPQQMAELTDEFIEAMSEDYDEDEEEDEEDEEDEVYEDEEDEEEQDTRTNKDGRTP